MTCCELSHLNTFICGMCPLERFFGGCLKTEVTTLEIK